MNLVVLLQAEKILYERNLDKDYAGMMGYADFCREAYKLAVGPDLAAKETLVKGGWSVWGRGTYIFVFVRM